MKLNWITSPILIFTAITLLFFYKFFLHGLIPIPGDLLITEYNPWKMYSYLGYLPGTFPSKLQYFDILHQMYPWKTFMIDSFRSGQIPLWNPYSFAGQPFLANIQSQIFYPTNIFYFVLSQPIAWGVSIAFQPFVAMIGTYLFAKKIGLSKTASIFSSITFSFSLFMTTFLEYNTIGHILALLPLSLYGVELIIKRSSNLGIIIFTFSIALSIFAGHIQLAGFNIIFVALYIILRIVGQKEKIREAVLFIILGALGIGLSFVQLLPTLELIKYSARVPQNYDFLISKLLIQPAQFILFVSPDFFGNPATRNYMWNDSYPGNSLYVGIITIILAISSIVYFKKNWFVKFFSISTIVLIIFFFRNPVSEIFFKLNIPFFSTGSPTNAIYLLSFSLSILAGFGLDHFIESKKSKNIIISLGVIALLIVSSILLKDIANFKNVILSLTLACSALTVLLIARLTKIKREYLAFLLILVATLDLFYLFVKFNPFVPQSIIFPETNVFKFLSKNSNFNRMWGYGQADIEPNFTVQYKIASPEGTDPLYPKIYGEFVQSSKNGKIATSFSNNTRSDALIPNGNGDDLEKNDFRLKVLDTLGVKYILDKKNSDTSLNTFPETKYKEAYQDDVWRVYENLNAANRIFFADNIYTYNSVDEFNKKFFNSEFNPKADVLIEANTAQLTPSKFKTVTLSKYSPNEIVANTKSDGNNLLVLSDTYFPGWKATIDDKPTTIYKTNYAFRGVVVPQGEHTVKFLYQPSSFSNGVIISLISCLLIIVLCILNLRKAFIPNGK